jgi:hypothetical protein
MPDFFISFANQSGFLGATVVSAPSQLDALDEATRRGFNPGGEAAILPMPPIMTPKDINEMDSYRNRLVSKQELLSNGAKRVGDIPEYAQERFDAYATFVCEEHNK